VNTLAQTYSELCIDWLYETLLANQNKPTGQFGAPGASANAVGGENAQQHVLSGDQDMAEDGATAFGYSVHNGNGNADY
jgi:hypothetical protein